MQNLYYKELSDAILADLNQERLVKNFDSKYVSTMRIKIS